MKFSVGDKVIASFTNMNNIIRFKGRVTKVNVNTYRVESLEDGVNGWEAGHEFIIQSENSPLETNNNKIIKKFED